MKMRFIGKQVVGTGKPIDGADLQRLPDRGNDLGNFIHMLHDINGESVVEPFAGLQVFRPNVEGFWNAAQMRCAIDDQAAHSIEMRKAISNRLQRVDVKPFPHELAVQQHGAGPDFEDAGPGRQGSQVSMY